MSSSKFFNNKMAYNTSIYEYIKKIRLGDTKLRNQLINDYLEFIAKSVSKVSRKYEDIRSSDRFSIGMIAFNDALDNYDENRGCSFFSYCDLLIRSRIIDYYRKNEKEQREYPFTYFENKDEINFEEKYLKSNSFNEYENIEIKEEIEFIQKKLSEFNISLHDVIREIPKHKDSFNMCIKIAESLCYSDYLYNKLMKSKTIPLKELLMVVDVHKRTIERNRKFIIAISLMVKADSTFIKLYI